MARSRLTSRSLGVGAGRRMGRRVSHRNIHGEISAIGNEGVVGLSVKELSAVRCV